MFNNLKKFSVVAVVVACLGALYAVPAQAGTVNVTVKSFSITMPSKIKAGKVTFKVHDSSGTHGFCIAGKCSSTLGTGQSTSLSVTLKKGKSYTAYCPVDSHRGMGMSKKVKAT